MSGAAILLSALTATVHAQAAETPASQPTTPATQSAITADLLFEDPTGTTSATVTQVYPNSSTSILNLDKVTRIRVKSDILIIEWGGTATTLLPRQYIAAITLNKRK
jgi:hypothetical protein